MKQQQENRFKSKFYLLNSQKSSEEIIWSCSDSSDYENTSYNENNVKPVKRKRRPVKSKKNVSKNISNLDITIIDGTEGNNEKNIEKSPDCSNVQRLTNLSNIGSISPILTSSQRYFGPLNNKSPVICLSNFKENKPTSPVLLLKSSQKFSPKIRKKLFDCSDSVNIHTSSGSRSVSPVLTCIDSLLKNNGNFKNKDNITKSKDKQEFNYNVCKKSKFENHKNINHNIKQEFQFSNEEIQNDDILNDTSSIKNVALIEKVKSYFDSHFSSTTPSQHSISECESKSSPKSNDEIEVINSLTDVRSSPSIKLENKSSLDSIKLFDDVCVHKTKKVRYKRGGLAHRLNELLKKQNASTSLWYHERFLAENSNFVLPKEEFVAFRIEKVTFKYGCYLLNVLDVNDENCLIFINNLYVKSNTIDRDAIFKLYKPYKMLKFEGYNLIINICKYECIVLKK